MYNVREFVPEVGVVLVWRVAVVEDDGDGGAAAAGLHPPRPLRDSDLAQTS